MITAVRRVKTIDLIAELYKRPVDELTPVEMLAALHLDRVDRLLRGNPYPGWPRIDDVADTQPPNSQVGRIF